MNRSFALSEKRWKGFLRDSAARNMAVVKVKADHRRALRVLRGEAKDGAVTRQTLGVVADEAVLF